MGWPVLGETAEFAADPAKYIKQRMDQHGPIWKTHLLFQPTVFLFEVEAVRKVLLAEHKLAKQEWPFAFKALLGPSFQGSKKRHAFHRKSMGAAFTAEAINSYLPTMEAVVRRRLDAYVAKGPEGYKGWDEHHILSFEVAALLLTGFDLSDGGKLDLLHQRFKTFVAGFVLGLPAPEPTFKYVKGLLARRDIVNTIEENLRQVLGEVEAAKASGATAPATGRLNALQAFISATDEDGNTASYEDIREMTLFTLFAGHETTGTSISQMLRLLAQNPRVLAALRQEQAAVVAKYGEALTPEAMSSMPYTDAVVRETLRIAPVVGMLWRNALEDFEVDGRRVPAGWRVVLGVKQAMQAIPEWVTDHESFRPERWLEYDPQGRKQPDGFLAFGAGARTCLGYPLAIAEMRIVAALLARHYEFELLTDFDTHMTPAGPTNGMPVVMRHLQLA